MTLAVDEVAGPTGFGDPEEWNQLVAVAPGGSFFQTVQWCTSWWSELAGRPELAVARVTRGERLVGGGALARVRLPTVRALRLGVEAVTNAGAGAGGADHCGFPIHPDAVPDAVDVLWHWALEWSSGRPLLLANLDPDTPVAARAQQELAAVGEELCPRAVTPGDPNFDLVRANWTKNRRKTIGRKLREFAAAGGSFEWVDNPPRVVELLPSVFALHRTRRRRLGSTTTFGTSPESRSFHSQLARYADSISGCWIQLARVDGEVVGALYGFRLAETYSVYQSGWDPAWAEKSLGLIQYAEAFRHSVERGGTTFDMCRGADPYKLRFATETRTEHSYARAPGVGGALLRARWAARRRRRHPSVKPESV